MQGMERQALSGFDNLYMPMWEVNNMAGRRPMYDDYVRRAVVAWSVHFPDQPFTSKDIQGFMVDNKMQLKQSRGALTAQVIANRLAFWSKKSKYGLVMISQHPHTYLVNKGEEE